MEAILKRLLETFEGKKKTKKQQMNLVLSTHVVPQL